MKDKMNLDEYEICLVQLDQHYFPCVITILERYHFGLRELGKGGSVKDYLTCFRMVPATLKFGAGTDKRFLDQSVLKCKCDKMREELWLKDEPPLKELLVISKRVEHMLKCVS